MKDIFKLNSFATPIIQIPNIENQLYVKRDDLLPFSFGGNKLRIALEFIKDMYDNDMDCIVGYGNARSNLSRALANLCYSFKIPCHIISPSDEDGTRIETFNSRIVQSCEAEFHYCKKDNVKNTVEEVLSELRDKGYKPYYIYGDSTGVGNEHIPLIAYKKVYEEIKGEYDYIFLATGTGMTQGGLLVGKSINKGMEKIVGISVARSTEREFRVLKGMLNTYSNQVEKVEVQPEDIIIDDSYLCNGYGTYNREIEKVILEQMMVNGMPLDPTYTGKAFWGMMDYLDRNEIQGKKVLFIHTGGTPLFFDYERGIKLKNVEDIRLIQEAVVALEKNLVPSLRERNIDLKTYSDKLSKYGSVWCHYDCGKPVSLLAGYCNDENNYTAYLTILAVNEDYQCKKLGTTLLAEYELYAQECGMKKSKLEVRKNNTKAQTFYKKHGYQIIGDASETSYYMEKIFSNPIGGEKEFYKFLYKVDTLFPTSLSEKEDLKELTEKILRYGLISSIKVDNELVALVAGYANDFQNYIAYISIVVTLPEYSGKGYGELAVKDFISKCVDRGMKAIHLYAVPTNTPAMNMYKKLGFVDYEIENEPRPNDAHFILYL